MKTRMIMISGLFVLLFTGCQQEQTMELKHALDVAISFDAGEKNSGIPDYLNVSLKNDSPNAISLPDGLMVLEFTSYSGSIQRLVPLTEDMIESYPAWDQFKTYSLQPGEKLDLRIGIAEILMGSPDRLGVELPADSYTLNAFITPEKDAESIRGASKIRSNYIDLEVPYVNNELSLNDV